jgi:DNA-binding transcriptional MerR regulator
MATCDTTEAGMRIGELAEAAGTTTKTLRFYEDQGLLPTAERTPAGYRDYTPDAVSRIDFVHRGQAAGLTLAQIKQILDIRDHGQAPCGHVRGLLDARLADIDRQIADLGALRDNVASLRDAASDPEPDTCGADEVCRYL